MIPETMQTEVVRALAIHILSICAWWSKAAQYYVQVY